MRLLNITLNEPILTEGYIRTQLVSLAEFGWEISFLHAGAQDGESIVIEAVGKRIEVEHFAVKTETRRAPTTPFARASKIAATIASRNSEVTSDDELTAWREKIAKARPDVILVQFGTTAARILPALMSNPAPWIVHFHGFDITQRCLHWGYRWAVHELGKHANAVFGCSQFVCGELRRLMPNAAHNRIHCVSPGYDQALFHDKGCEYDRDGDRRCNSELLCGISVARLIEGKGHHFMIDAFRHMRHKARLRIVGEGDARSSLENQIREFGLGERVELLGALPPDRVREELRAADFFVQSSTRAGNGWREGLGLSPIEAAAVGLPVVVADSGGLAEAFRHNENGLVVPENDPPALATALDQIVADPETRDRLARACASSMRSGYAADIQAGRADKIMRDLLN